MSTQQDCLERTYVIIQLGYPTKPRDVESLRDCYDADVIARVDTDGRYLCRVPTIALQDIPDEGYVRGVEPYGPQHKISEPIRRGIQLFLTKRSQQDNGISVQRLNAAETRAPSSASGATSPTVPLPQQEADDLQRYHAGFSVTEHESIDIVEPPRTRKRTSSELDRKAAKRARFIEDFHSIEPGSRLLWGDNPEDNWESDDSVDLDTIPDISDSWRHKKIDVRPMALPPQPFDETVDDVLPRYDENSPLVSAWTITIRCHKSHERTIDDLKAELIDRRLIDGAAEMRINDQYFICTIYDPADLETIAEIEFVRGIDLYYETELDLDRSCDLLNSDQSSEFTSSDVTGSTR